MSEQEPRKEQHLTDCCDNCEQDYDLTPNNTALRKFNKKPECNYLYTIHADCSNPTIIFIGSETTEVALEAGIPFVEDDYPEEEEYDRWLKVNEIELIKEHELSPRQENFIKYFGYLLKNNLFDPIRDRWV
jgi:hypothetical protein